MAEPTITHIREHGGTFDHQAINIKVERTAILDDELRNVIDRSFARVLLITRDGYTPAHRYVLTAEAAAHLRDALNSALADVHDLEESADA